MFTGPTPGGPTPGSAPTPNGPGRPNAKANEQLLPYEATVVKTNILNGFSVDIVLVTTMFQVKGVELMDEDHGDDGFDSNGYPAPPKAEGLGSNLLFSPLRLTVSNTLIKFAERTPSGGWFSSLFRRRQPKVIASYPIHPGVKVYLDESTGVISVLYARDFFIHFTCENPYMVDVSLRGIVATCRYIQDFVSVHTVNKWAYYPAEKILGSSELMMSGGGAGALGAENTLIARNVSPEEDRWDFYTRQMKRKTGFFAHLQPNSQNAGNGSFSLTPGRASDFFSKPRLSLIQGPPESHMLPAPQPEPEIYQQQPQQQQSSSIISNLAAERFDSSLPPALSLPSAASKNSFFSSVQYQKQQQLLQQKPPSSPSVLSPSASIISMSSSSSSLSPAPPPISSSSSSSSSRPSRSLFSNSRGFFASPSSGPNAGPVPSSPKSSSSSSPSPMRISVAEASVVPPLSPPSSSSIQILDMDESHSPELGPSLSLDSLNSSSSSVADSQRIDQIVRGQADKARQDRTLLRLAVQHVTKEKDKQVAEKAKSFFHGGNGPRSVAAMASRDSNNILLSSGVLRASDVPAVRTAEPQSMSSPFVR